VRVSIIVPAFNEELLLSDTLGRIQKATAAFSQRGWSFEIIVCDNNSTDRTAEIAVASGARVVFEPVNQIGRARNTGAAAATGDWLVFVDADSHPSLELFDEAAGQMVSGDVIAGGATLRIDQKLVMGYMVTGLWNLASRCLKLMAGSFIFVEAAAFRNVGGFSDELFAAEEIEFVRRLKMMAKQSKRRIVILHHHPLTTSARKASLYTPWDHIRLLTRVVCSGGKALRNREATHLWYDGRR
jgi:glycosyltransferase involved in cell wall biosynthesis